MYHLLVYYFLLFRQWSALQDVVNKDSGSSKINNETLQQIRINNSPAPQNIKLQRAASAKKKKFYQPYDDKIEELDDTLALSMCNASDLSIFSDGDSRGDIILDESKLDDGFCIEIKSEKTRQIAARRSYSMTSTAKLSVFSNKNQIESDHVKIEALSDKKEIKKLVMKRRESRQQLNQSIHATPAPIPNVATPTYLPGAMPTYIPGATPTYIPGTTPTYIPGATPNYIPGATPTYIPGATPLASTPIKVHRFQEKKMIGHREKCVQCQSKIRIAKSFLKCKDCGLACHLECDINVADPCPAQDIVNRTPKTPRFNAKASLFQSPDII